jgi:hypothetical protein
VLTETYANYRKSNIRYLNAAEEIADRAMLPRDMSGIEEGTYLTTNGDISKGIYRSSTR